MITRPAAFRVYGQPVPKGSMIPRRLKDGRVVVVEDNKRTKPWRRAIEKAAPIHLPERADLYQPIKVTCLFGVQRLPNDTGLLAPVMQAGSHHEGGDVDKMVRLVLDALQGCGVLRNDAQVVRLGETAKVFADDPEWHQGVQRRFAVPGLYCRVEPVGWVPDPLPYERVLADDELNG